MKSLVILSGGQDSATCLAFQSARYGRENVHAITFKYGQRHEEAEINAAIEIAKEYSSSHKVIELNFMKELTSSKMLHPGDISEMEDGLPASFVPGRNQLFITIAYSHAIEIGADLIVIGVCQTDYSGYPDCRADFINAIANASFLGTGKWINISAPLMYLDKESTFRLAEDFGALEMIVNKTRTCYNGSSTFNEWGYGCGECPACKLRERGWQKFKNGKVS